MPVQVSVVVYGEGGRGTWWAIPMEPEVGGRGGWWVASRLGVDAPRPRAVSMRVCRAVDC